MFPLTMCYNSTLNFKIMLHALMWNTVHSSFCTMKVECGQQSIKYKQNTFQLVCEANSYKPVCWIELKLLNRVELTGKADGSPLRLKKHVRVVDTLHYQWPSVVFMHMNKQLNATVRQQIILFCFSNRRNRWSSVLTHNPVWTWSWFISCGSLCNPLPLFLTRWAGLWVFGQCIN